MKSPMSVYSEVPQNVEENPLSDVETPTTTNTSEISPFLPQHNKLPNFIQSVPIALAPDILPLTYNPNKKTSRNRHVLCRFRGIFLLMLVFLVLFVLIHYIVWLCLNKKDKDISLMDFIFK